MSRFRRARRQSPPSPGSLTGTTERMWRRKRVRMEDGVFFGDDTWVPLVPDSSEGFSAGERTGTEAIMEAEPDGWAELDSTPGLMAKTGDLVIDAGGGSGEGEGFVTAADREGGRFLWILHVNSGGRIASLSVEAGVVRASSESGTTGSGLEWTIPVFNPAALQCRGRATHK